MNFFAETNFEPVDLIKGDIAMICNIPMLSCNCLSFSMYNTSVEGLNLVIYRSNVIQIMYTRCSLVVPSYTLNSDDVMDPLVAGFISRDIRYGTTMLRRATTLYRYVYVIISR